MCYMHKLEPKKLDRITKTNYFYRKSISILEIPVDRKGDADYSVFDSRENDGMISEQSRKGTV